MLPFHCLRKGFDVLQVTLTCDEQSPQRCHLDPRARVQPRVLLQTGSSSAQDNQIVTVRQRKLSAR